MVLALVIVVGWLGFRFFESRRDQQRDAVYLQAARQGAVNLTTIEYTEVDKDIQRILESSTGEFLDDFRKRSQPFIDVVKQVQSKAVGTVTEAALESVDGDHARVLVAVSVKTSNVGATDQQPRLWRMRIDVQKIGETAKISNVQFVP
ncbi:mammalian cell entry protein [Mycobacterium vicinigordonae]|uniref:Mammalian cell entry protein n=1 Tax=Mycobacterium vicinigordonae TaxID=1719132 RepID=A0A7D6DWK1_9MYCO|nr:mammalian cell entry protein [Mycobacterium vicinigordonae]QLL06248.1 mammalian cell entry protein [Mycobacterium vicinigordonae]